MSGGPPDAAHSATSDAAKWRSINKALHWIMNLECRSRSRRNKRLAAFLAAVFHLIMMEESMQSCPRRLIRNSALSGRQYCNEFLAIDNELRFFQTTRMDHPTFQLLHTLLVQNGLSSSVFLKSEEKLIMFLYMLTGKEYRNIAERFQHSTSTVSRSIHEVLDIMDDIISEFMVPFIFTVEIVGKYCTC